MSRSSTTAHAQRKSPAPVKMAALYSAFQASTNPVFIIDRNGTITDANPAFVELYTKHFPRCIGANVFEDMASNTFAPKSSLDSRMAAIREVLRTGRSVKIEGYFDDKLLMQTLDPVLTPSGKLTGLCIVIHEIQEAKRLSDMRTQLDFILGRCNLGAWSMDLATGELLRTEEHERLFGDASSLDWDIDTFFSHILPEDRDRVDHEVAEILHTPRNWDMTYRIRRSDGEVRWIHDIGGYESDAEGRPLRLLGVSGDITEKKRQEELVNELQGRLNHSQKLELIGQLAGGIAHDVNNVLAAIQGNTEMALRAVGPESSISMHLTSVVNSVNRSAAMVRQLLAFARKQPMRPVDIEPDVELEKTRIMLGKLVRENISLDWNLDARHAVVRLDPSSLVQIMTNLVVNARDAITDGGRIGVSSGLIGPGDIAYDSCRERIIDGPHLRITVTDTGSGIDSKTLPHIFEPFFTTKGVGQGTGLGLSTVYGLVRQNNGHILCHSEVGKGSSFEIHFPAVAQTVVDKAAQPASLPEASHNGERILVVEDEQEIASIISMVLERQGYTVFTAFDAETALCLLERSARPFDLVITDVMLPGMNGVQMSRTVTKRQPWTKFLFMSGYSADAISHYGMFDEASNFITKPFGIKNFIDKVHASLTQEA